MFLIRAKSRRADQPGWVVMKTPLGALPVAFAAVEDARAYLRATGADSHCEARSHDDLLQSEPGAFEGVSQLLLIPSLDVARALLRDASSFPYDRYVLAIPSRD
jgi:hypothetical protein